MISFLFGSDSNTPLPQVLSDGTNTYLYGNGRIGEYGTSGWAYHHTDALGSVRLLTNSVGNVRGEASYTPFGDVMGSTAGSIFGFAGEQTDATGLQYLRARYYAPEQGRFLTTDPYAGMMALPYSLHPYKYGFSNPLRYIDPSGRIECDLLGDEDDIKSCRSAKEKKESLNQLLDQLTEIGTTGDVVSDLKGIESKFRYNSDATQVREYIRLIIREAVSLPEPLTPAQLAYVLATAQYESNFGAWMVEQGSERYFERYQEILGNRKGTNDHVWYKGRGFVQITGRDNYEKFSKILGEDIDLVENPELAADPAIAAKILVYGMANGTYVSNPNINLSAYINDEETDFYGARDIVNGRDYSLARDYMGLLAERYLGVLEEYNDLILKLSTCNQPYVPPEFELQGPNYEELYPIKPGGPL